MNARAEMEKLLVPGSGRASTDLVVSLIRERSELFPDLFGLYLENREPVSRKAAWVLDVATEQDPSLAGPILDTVAKLVPTFRNGAMKRHSLRILSRSPLPPEELLGPLITACFEWLLSPAEPPAVKVFCMEILLRAAIEEPGLRHELAESLRWRLDEESAGFKSRAGKVLRTLSRLSENGHA